MTKKENKNTILKRIKETGMVTVQELENILNVSGATVRSYLSELEEEGYLYRVHGGAAIKEKLKYELPFQERLEKSREEKLAIAHEALRLIQPNDAIFLDSGSTVLELAKLMKDLSDITVVTNSIPVLAELTTAPGINLISTGGQVTRNHFAFYGALARENLDRFNFNKSFLGTDGISVVNGLTTEDFSIAEIVRIAIKRSKENIVLADHTKIGTVSFASSISSLSQIDRLITDSQVDSEILNEIRLFEIEITTVKKELINNG